MDDVHDTIVAIASAAGGAARGIVRMSGPRALQCAQAICPMGGSDAWPARVPDRAVVLRQNLRAADLLGLVPAEVYVWPTARSYTRQPAVEIHTWGSPPVLQALVRSLCAAGARPAGPGEFTLRAFLAGRLDLTQAEAVLGVIDAADRDELDVALAQLAGGMARPLALLRDQLLDLLAHLEAGLDFVEEDIEFITAAALEQELASAAQAVDALAQRAITRTVAADAVRAVLVGPTNAGKSSLFNALLKHNAAIVSPTAGTTRDYLQGELELDGVRVELIDTAGTDDAASSAVASAAAEVANQQRRHAPIELVCVDASRPVDSTLGLELAAGPSATARLFVLTKVDCAPVVTTAETLRSLLPKRLSNHCVIVETSSESGQGLDALRDHLRELAQASQDHGHAGGMMAATAARCESSIRAAGSALARARLAAVEKRGEELVAADVREALVELGHVVGAVYTDDILDRVFSRFCIGK